MIQVFWILNYYEKSLIWYYFLPYTFAIIKMTFKYLKMTTCVKLAINFVSVLCENNLFTYSWPKLLAEIIKNIKNLTAHRNPHWPYQQGLKSIETNQNIKLTAVLYERNILWYYKYWKEVLVRSTADSEKGQNLERGLQDTF